ncbi:S-methyl-5'-thioadenosine phosphorylase [Sphingomonas sp. GCM10030256]|uniref:S-methyl-5'-thioadenosine phosphorylase n=1 Tax=Sphingomonas sp. GCM10030256 TaxID=3273427 RepID=UPI0036113EE7
MAEWCIGVLGGSGLYELAGLEDAEQLSLPTPWGAPSAPVTRGRIGGRRFVFLPRHGAGHGIGPSQVNARANVDALKRAGATDLLAISAVGSLREELVPGEFVLVDQFVDRTRGRPSSFFGDGIVAHVSMADPVCPRLSGLAGEAARQAGAKAHDGGTYLAMEGPQFSTRAESRLYRQWGCDVIGMTAMPEAKLAREAELPYALVAMVTDYDCWRDGQAAVEVESVLATMRANAKAAARMLVALAAALPERREASQLDTVLDYAIVTPPAERDARACERLDAVAGRALRSAPA